MKIWHILPKKEFSIPVDKDHYVLVHEICAEDPGPRWHVRTKSDWKVTDADVLKQAVCQALQLPGIYTPRRRYSSQPDGSGVE